MNGTGTRFHSAKGVLFDSMANTLVRVPPSYPVPAFIIPPGTVRIGDYAFHNCTILQEIVIPASVALISGTSLTMTTNLQRFTVDKQNPHFCDIDGVLFSKDRKRLIAYPGGRYGTYAVPESVQELGDYCFYSVMYVKKNLNVIIPNESSIKKGLSIFNPTTEPKKEDDES
jgi:hypothetical protein